jgi:hypothetical protein
LERKYFAFFLVSLIGLSSIAITCTQFCLAETKIVNHTYYFHNYSVILRDDNGSFIAYNEADTANPTGAGSQVNMQSQITGTRDGWNYYSAVALWALPLQSDTHVKGTVTVSAYIGSNYKLAGLFSGGGYGFGIVDVDENNGLIQQFVTEGPITIGSNPFTATATKYSLSVNVDYTFKKGHSIGFAVGFGATVKGFEATIYFDSTNWNSGAILPVEETSVDPTPTPTPTSPPALSPSSSASVAPEYPAIISIVGAVFFVVLLGAFLLRARYRHFFKSGPK